MVKRLIFSIFFLFSLPLVSFAALPLDEQPFFFSNSCSVYVDSSSNRFDSFDLRPVPMAIPSYDRATYGFYGSSSPYQWGKFRIRFGRKDESSGEIPLSYTTYFSLGSSFFVDTTEDFETLDFGSYSSIFAFGSSSYDYYGSVYPDISGGPEISSMEASFRPINYAFSSVGSVSPHGFASAHSLGYSDRHSWSYWTGIPNSGSFNTTQTSPLYYKNWVANFDPHSTLNLHWEMSDTQVSSFYISKQCEGYFNFSAAYSSALATGMSNYSFALTPDSNFVENVLNSVKFSLLPDSIVYDEDFRHDIISLDRYYHEPLDPYKWDFDFTCGIYYYLFPCDSNGSVLSSRPLGPYLWGVSYPISDIDVQQNYVCSLTLYFDEVSLSMQDFDPVYAHYSNAEVWSVDPSYPALFQASSSTRTTTFGSNCDLEVYFDNIYGVSFRPTIYADGSSMDDLNDSLNSGFDNLGNSVNTGFSSLRDVMREQFNQVFQNQEHLNTTIEQSTQSINNMLNYVSNQITNSIEDGFYDLTNGYDSRNAQSLLDEYERTNSELDDAAGDLFDIINAALDQSSYTIPSWADFSSLFTAFQFVGNYGLTAVYTLLGGAAVIGLVLAFYFALKALWAIIHRGN